MKKQNAVLAFLLLAFSFGWAGAEDFRVKVTSDRAAVVQVTDKQPADPNVAGSLQGSADLKSGKSAFQGDFTLKNSPELQGTKGGMFASLTSKTVEFIAFVDGKIPQDPNSPKILEVLAQTKTEGDQSAVEFRADITAPKTTETMPTGSGSATLEGDFTAFKSSGDFNLAGGEIQSAQIPFKKFYFGISEAENKTTLTFEMTVPKTSSIAQQLDQIPMMAPQVEAQLKQANIKYEGLEFPAPTEEGELKTGKAKVTIVALRDTIRPFLGFAAGNLQAEVGPDVDVQGAMSKMLDVRLDNVNITLNADGDKLDGKFQGDLSALNSFYDGYFVLLPAFQKQSNQQMAQDAGEFGPLIATFLNLNSEQAVKAMRAAVDSGLKLQGDFKFSLEAKEQDAVFNATANLLSSNYKAYVAKSRELGLPVAEKAAGNLEISLKEGTNLVGQAYFYTDGDLVAYYKNLLTDAAKQSGATEEAVQALSKLELNEVAMKAEMQDGKVNVIGKGDTSDLTNVTKLLFAKAAPQLQAVLTGLSLSVNLPDAAEGSIDFKAYFSEFLPGKSEAQIKEILGLPANATVALNGTADDVKLVAVEAPELTLGGRLAEVQAEGQKLLAASPAEVGGGGASGGGKWALIALGCLVLVGVAGFLMFGGKNKQ